MNTLSNESADVIVTSSTSNSVIPLIFIALFFTSMLVVGKIASKKVTNSEDYIVAGRNIPLPLIVGTLFATFWGGGTIIGATGMAYNHGIFGVVEDPFAAGLSLILIGIFFVRILRRLNIRSVGEIYKVRFGKTIGYTASAFMIPTYLIWTAVQLLAVGKILNVLFSINFTLAFIIAAVVVILFTFMGGLVGVVWTDGIQMILIFVGLVLILTIGLNRAGGFQTVLAHTPEKFFNILPRENSIASWVSYIALWCGMALGNIPSPDLAQRAFMAQDEKTAKKGMIIAGFLYWIIGFVPIIIALIAITLVSQGVLNGGTFAQDSELLIPHLAVYLLSPVPMGIFIASLAASILSSASSSLFATAVLFSNDIYKPLVKDIQHKDISDKEALVSTKVFILIAGSLSVGIGLINTEVYQLTVFAFTLQFGMLFFPFVFALKAKFPNRYGIMSGMLVGFGIHAVGVITQGTFLPEPWEFFTLVPPLANCLTIIIVSRLTRGKSTPGSLEEIYLQKPKEINEV